MAPVQICFRGHIGHYDGNARTRSAEVQDEGVADQRSTAGVCSQLGTFGCIAVICKRALPPFCTVSAPFPRFLAELVKRRYKL